MTETLPNGKVVERISSYTELGTGLHYFEAGEWKETREEIEIVNGSAVARRGPHQVIFAANPNSAGAIDFLSPDGKRFRSHVVGLAYTDAATGRSVLIAEIRNCVGAVLPPNQIIYSDAFVGDCAADIRYTYTRSGFEQDIIIVKSPPSPSEWGLDPETTRLEVFTEFDEMPVGTKSDVVVSQLTDRALAANMVEPDLIDQQLDFGVMKIGQGLAFPLEEEDAFSGSSVPTGKSIEIIEERVFLIEKVDYLSIRGSLERLPQMAAALPKRNPGPAGNRLMMAGVLPPPTKGNPGKWKVGQFAKAEPASAGFVIDYLTVNGSLTNYIFKSDSTYVITNTTHFYGTSVLEGGAVIKHGNNAMINFYGDIDCRTAPYRVATFTAKDDDTVGQSIAGSTGNPTNSSYGLYVIACRNTAQRYNLHDLKIRHGGYAFALLGGAKADLSNIQAVKTLRFVGLQANSDVSSRNVLLADMLTCFQVVGSPITNRVEHATLHRVGTFLSSTSYVVTVTNSLIISTTNNLVFQGSNVITNLDDTGIFETVGAGAHYLPTNSVHRNAGTTNINAELRKALGLRTTTAPMVIEPVGYYTNNLDLVPQAERDLDTPDLGYHYDPLDHVLSGMAVMGARITASNGVAIGAWTRNGYSLLLGDNAELLSVGLPHQPNRIVRYNMVQEQANTNWTSSTFGPLLQTALFASGGSPLISAQFTHFSVPANDAYLLSPSDSDTNLHNFAHSEFHGGKITTFAASLAFTNCLFNRVDLSMDDGWGAVNPTHTFQNATFFAGTNTLSHYGTGTWTFRDSLFDQTGLSQNGDVTATYNGYTTNTVVLSPSTNAHNALYASNTVSFHSGLLGSFYLPTNSPFLGAGSTNAQYLGLYHFTTLNSYEKEGTSVVDLGYHTVAVDGNGQPIDTDGDGVADYLEDVNGNGLTDSGETCFHDPSLILAASVDYIKGSPPKLLDTNAIVTDAVSPNFDGGQLKVSISSGVNALDILAIRHQGSAAGQIGTSTNGNVNYSGTNIATFSGGPGTNALVVSFNANTTVTAVQALVRNLTFNNSSNNPPASARTLTFVLTDGDGGTNAPTSMTVNIICPEAIDAMLVMDVSQSLSWTNFQKAKEAATNFVGRLEFPTDRVGLVSFAGEVQLEHALTTNGIAVQSTILGFTTRSGTYLHDAIKSARTNLMNSGSNVLRLILLTSDGIISTNKAENTNAALAEAKLATDAGIRLVTIAYGNDAEGTNLMKSIASSLADFFYALDPSESNYLAIAETICRGNESPVVSILSPTNGAFFPGLSVPITVQASDSDGSIVKLEVFAGTSLIASNASTNLTTTWYPTAGGTYLLTAKATDDQGAFATSTIVTVSVNSAPLVDAGNDQDLTLVGTNPAIAYLNGIVTNADALPTNATLTIVWKSQTNSGSVYLSPDPSDPSQPRKGKVTFTRPGIYTLRLSASDSILSAWDDLVITVSKTNEAPQVYAGPNQTIEFPNPVYLPGVVTDDGAPIGGTLTVKWLGPSGTVFVADSVTNTFARFAAPGLYQISLTASDGGLSATQSVTITVTPTKEQTRYSNADFVSGAVGGIRGHLEGDSNPHPGSGAITLSGLVTNVRQAYLFWHGPVDSENPMANSSLLVNGRWIEGMNLGIAHSDNWNYQGSDHSFAYAHSYRADITALVRAGGNAVYTLTNLAKGHEVEVNGASIIVIQDSPDPQNPKDLILWNGNDSNETLDFYPMLDDSFSRGIHSIALSDSRVFLGGNFGSGVVTNRNHFVSLKTDGRLDPTFAATSGVAAASLQINAVLPLSDGSVLIAGYFTEVEGQTRKHIARFESSGALATNFNLDINGMIRCMAKDQNGRILIGGDFTTIGGQSRSKVARLLGTGLLDTNFVPPTTDISVFAIASDRNTNVLIGGDFQWVGASQRNGLARLSGTGALQGAVNPNIGYGVRALLPNDSGTIYIGGDFSSVGGTARYGIARLNEDLTLDTSFTNSVAGTKVVNGVSAGAPSVHALMRLATNQIVLAGRFVKVDGEDRERIAAINETSGTLDGFQSSVIPDLLFNSGDLTAIDSIAIQADGKYLVAGNFRTIDGGLAVAGAYRLLTDGSLDPSFRVTDVGSLVAFADVHHISGDDVSIELHVSDGQSYKDPYHFSDPEVFINGSLWMTNVSLETCGTYNDWQIFAGQLVFNQYWQCPGLWDVTNRVVSSNLLSVGTKPLILSSAECPASGCLGSDLVTWVAAVVRMPSDTNVVEQGPVAIPTDLPPLAWPDSFAVNRSLGRRVLNVLSNDICPHGGLLKISRVGVPSHGRAQIAYEGSAILYTAISGYSGSDAFTYTVVDENGNAAWATVAIEISGDQDPVAINVGERKTGTLGNSGYQTMVRGNTQHAEHFQFNAVRGDSVDLVVSNAAFESHVYVFSPSGQLIASGSHVEGGTDDASIIDLPVLETGSYAIEVTSHNVGSTGAYDLHLSSDLTDYRVQPFINGIPLQMEKPYFLGVIGQSETMTNAVVFKNPGRKTFNSHTLNVTGNNSVASIAPLYLDALPSGRSSTPHLLSITPGGSVLGLVSEILSTYEGGTGISTFYTNQFFVNASGAALPNVVVSAPPDGAVLRAPASVTIRAAVTNYSGTIARVDFYADSPTGRQKIGGAVELPFSVNWFEPPSGVYQIFAVASNYVNSGDIRMSVSPPIILTIANRDYNSRPAAAADTVPVALNSRTNFLNVLANDTDADGDTLRIISLTGTTKGTLSIAGNGRGLLYTPPADTYGEEAFAYTVDDGINGRSTAVVTVRIVAATAEITAPTSTNALSVSTPVQILVDAVSSQGAILSVDVLTNGVKLGTIITRPYAITWTPLAAGFYTLKAVAYDDGGIGVESVPVTVGVGSPGQGPPLAAIGNIREGDRVRDGVLNLLGTADSTNAAETVSYQLKLWKQGTNGLVAVTDFTPTPTDGNGLYEGRVAAGGLLATLDLTGIRNGPYVLSLAVRADGKETRSEVRFVLESNAKLGQFSFSEEDLVVPLGGVPISIVRTYDSLKTDLGDFGTSWTYSINDLEVEIDEQRGFVEDEDTNKPFSMRLGGGRNITLTLPGGQRTTFIYSLNPGAADDGIPCFCYEAKWEAAPGIHAQLTPLDNNRLQFIPWQQVIPPYWLDAEDTPFDSYDFSGFVLTNADGTEYVLKGDDLGDHSLPPEASQMRGVHAYGTPKLRLIRTRSGDEIITQSGTNFLRVIQYNPMQQPQIVTNSILLVRNGDGLIQSAYGPDSLNTDGSLKSGAVAHVRYAYSNLFLVAVERLVKSSPLTYETNRYEYTNATHPHFITGIIDARGLRVATTGKDAQGRLTSLKGVGQSQGTRFIHDAQNLREITIDPLGYQTIHEFDRRGNVVRTIDALGRTTQREYDDAGNQLSETDPLGRTQRFAYDSSGNRTMTVDALGHTNTATFGPRRQLLTSVDALVRGMTNVYDAADNLLFTTNALGHVTRFVYDSRGLLASSVDPLGNLTTNRYDANGRLTNTATISAQSSILSSNSFAYDERGNRTNETTWVTIDGAVQSVTTSHEFDARNRLVRSLDALGYTNSTVYNALGKAESAWDKMGRETRYWYDARGNLIQTEHPSDANTPAAVTRTVYDELNRAIYTQWRALANSPSDSGEITANATHTIYDPLGRVVRTESLTNVVIGWTTVDGAPATVLASPGGLFSDTTTEFDEGGRVSSQTDARGVTTFFDYDDNDRQTASTVHDDFSRAMTTRSLFDAVGNRTVTLDALGRGTTNVLDALNRSVETQLADGTKRLTLYDELGRRVGEVDQAGVTNRFGYDGLGRLLAVTNAWATPNATWATYQFDELGRQTNQVDALGRVTRFDFDRLGRRVKRTLPGGQSEGFAYNAAGNTTWHTNFNGQAIRMDYDAASRLLAKVYPDGTSNTFAYTVTGQRWKTVDASGVATNQLDRLDRIIQRDHYEAGSLQSRLVYDYDERGNLSGVQGYSAYSGGSGVSYAYDSLNRLAAVSDSGITSYQYDLVGNVEGWKTTNGVMQRYLYDRVNRLTNLVVLAGAVTLAQFDYALGSTGQRESLIEHVDGVWRTNDWKYDKQYRLTNELLRAASGDTTGQLAYAYDLVANRTNRTSTLSGTGNQAPTYNTNDWLTADVYDSAGNTRTNAAGSVFQYNADNQVTNVVNGAMTIALVYNADGHRIRKSVNVGGNTTNTYFLIDEHTPTGYAQVLEERLTINGVDQPWILYTYGLDLISQRVGSTATNYFAYDGHGSVRLLTGAGTNVTDTYTYDAYGSLIASTGTTLNHFLYTGEQWDEDLQMYYLRARYMSPETGRFLTMDSYEGSNEDPMSLHKFLYAHGNPVNMVDPSGHESQKTKLGKAVHKKLGEIFTGNGIIPLRFSGPSITSIGGRLKLPIPKSIQVLFPDLVDAARKEVYEIKPLTPYGLATGFFQALGYVSLLNQIDPVGGWHLGNTWSPPSFILLPPRSGFAGGVAYIFPPVGGVIFYEAMTIQQLAKRGNRTVRSSQRNQLQQQMGIATILSTMGGF